MYARRCTEAGEYRERDAQRPGQLGTDGAAASTPPELITPEIVLDYTGIMPV